MIIERLKKEDIEKYKLLIDSCFGSSNEIDKYNTYDENNSNYEIIVAKDEEKIVGSITFYRINLFTYGFQPAYEIFNVAVLEEYRGKKIARLLLDYIISKANDENYNSIFLTCLENAHSAHKLYESVGFIRTTSVKFVLDLKEGMY